MLGMVASENVISGSAVLGAPYKDNCSERAGASESERARAGRAFVCRDAGGIVVKSEGTSLFQSILANELSHSIWASLEGKSQLSVVELNG